MPEAKILVLSCYFIIFGMIALITLSYRIRDAHIILDKLLLYFTCPAGGYSSDNTCSAEYDKFVSYLKPELNQATYLLLSLVPWSNILYAVQFTDINVIQMIKHACQHKNHSEKSSTSCNNATQY